MPEEIVRRKRRKETEEEVKRERREREKEKEKESPRRRVRSSIVVDNPPRRFLPPSLPSAFVFLVIVAVPSGGRLWLASRWEKQTEERRTERQEETGGQRRTVG